MKTIFMTTALLLMAAGLGGGTIGVAAWIEAKVKHLKWNSTDSRLVAVLILVALTGFLLLQTSLNMS